MNRRIAIVPMLCAAALFGATWGCELSMPPVFSLPPPLMGHRALRPIDRRVAIASWYGREFARHRTASGERFDPRRMTAASNSLPLGTCVTVTNLENGRSAAVRINDRGPFVSGRDIDLSRRAAERLGFKRAGLALVGIRVVDSPNGLDGVRRISQRRIASRGSCRAGGDTSVSNRGAKEVRKL